MHVDQMTFLSGVGGGNSPLMNVLVVDDEPDINTTLKATLEEEGFKVYVFDDPIEALEHFRKSFYDLLIFDIKMPKMNGFDLYREIKKIDSGVKVCFLTAGEMYYGDYSDIFSSLPSNCFCIANSSRYSTSASAHLY